MIEHLYVHIPFCDHICFYCDFFKIKKSRDEMVNEYLLSLEQEISQSQPPFKLKTIYLGGGTPNSLDDKQLEKLLQLLQKNDQTAVVEYTTELNPEKITKSQLQLLKNYHVNRLSIGVQTFNDQLLKKINRHHSVADVVASYNLARDEGFDNISFDLIYNLFDQTTDDIQQDLIMVKQLQPDHISWYSLILKENSYWGKTKVKLPDYDIAFDEIINAALNKMGYVRYEISNYTNNNKKSQHNLGYWTNKSFWLFGPGAAGFINEDGHYLLENTRKYANWTQQKTEILLADYYFQILMMGLRVLEGINLATVKDAQAAITYYETKIADEVAKNNLVFENNHLRCTKQGLNILNDILVNIME
ncbi:radical SAM family heme chaperone HemW [Spiroplasma endosymbiont of Glossina fuscipes fuscipes]|uniref:radical SAM family heme chaperone HemW n=1 Tax=Spiroplasma endosymbiont of Glossina fuscipes fuscipes TaxID=2004463 RepID=UPI003C77BEFE